MVDNSNEPLVSVIMPFYKGSKYMEEAVLSVKNQTYRNIEIVVVNDSPENDQETEYLISLQEKYSFKLIHHDHNRGATKALATGFKNSSGDFISLLGQDDLLVPEKIRIQVDFFKENENYVWLYGNMEIWNVAENTRTVPDIEDTFIRIKEKNIFPDLYKGNRIKGLFSQASLARRVVIEKDILPLWYKLPGDVWPVNIRLFEKYYDQIAIMKEPMTIYRLHEANTISDKHKMFSLIIPTIVEMCPKEMQKELIWSKINKFIGDVDLEEKPKKKDLRSRIKNFFKR